MCALTYRHHCGHYFTKHFGRHIHREAIFVSWCLVLASLNLVIPHHSFINFLIFLMDGHFKPKSLWLYVTAPVPLWLYTLIWYSVWHPELTKHQHMALERIQKKACKIMLGNNYSSYEDALIRCNLHGLRNRRNKICLQFANKLVESPKFCHWLPRFRGETGRTLRNAHLLSIPRVRTERHTNSPIPCMVQLWNQETPGVWI